MMLRYTFSQEEAAKRIEAAVKIVLSQGYRTADIYATEMRRVSTIEMGDAVVAAMK
jgi:3-isopropylmalate dehydrogenase